MCLFLIENQVSSRDGSPSILTDDCLAETFGADKGVTIIAILIIPPWVKMVSYYTVLTPSAIRLGWMPGYEVHFGPVRPHPPPLHVDVRQTHPGSSLRRVESLDQDFDELVFCLTVHRDQVCSLSQTVGLSIRPVQWCSDILIAASVKIVPAHWAGVLG